MRAMDVADEKVEPDAAREGELADEDLEDLAGGVVYVPPSGSVGSAAQEDAQSRVL